jgi:Na+-driven multidrug efflux pump
MSSAASASASAPVVSRTRTSFASFTKSVWWNEASLMLELAVPSAILELGYLIPSFVAASYIGRNYGPVYLSGFQLANLTTNLFTLSLMYGMYSACETLAPQSYGAKNYREVGVLAIRGFLSSMIVILPMALLVLVYIKDILIVFGQDEEASELASIWYAIYIISFPFSSILMAIFVFLLSQNVLRPIVMTEVINVSLLLPLSMWLWTHFFGYQGTAAAVVTYEAAGTLLIVSYLCFKKPYKKRCWPGFREGFKDAVGSWEANQTYLFLGAGGILASSECTFTPPPPHHVCGPVFFLFLVFLAQTCFSHTMPFYSLTHC